MEESIFISFILGSIATLFGGIVAHIFSERRDRRKEFHQACIKFRIAFVDEIRLLKDRPIRLHPDIKEICPYVTIVNAYPKHFSAYILFREHLSSNVRIAFDKAWKDYCYPEKNKYNLEPLFAYIIFKAGPESDIPYDKTYITNRIDTLLSFAKINR